MKNKKHPNKKETLENNYEKSVLLTLKKENVSSQDDEEISNIHSLGSGILCDTEARGFATPQGKDPLKLVLDASNGFIPLWAKNTILRWRFQERSFIIYENPNLIKEVISDLLGEAILKWGDSAPVKFTKDNDLWDFEIVLRHSDECSIRGCVLASAFFPDAGRHELVIYPKLFDQSPKEQIDTIIHEIGHVFGLRHFFANISERSFPSVNFGNHNQFSIMNYGDLSELSEHDKNDLKILYQSVWNGELQDINGTPIRQVKPYHTTNLSSEKIYSQNTR